MGIIVCKFGGTSVASGARFKMVKAILDEDPDRRYAVLSAPGTDGRREKVTDSLYRLWQVRNNRNMREKLIATVVRRFDGMCHMLGLKNMERAVREALDAGLRISEAHTVSRGEYLCARLFSEYTGWPLVDASSLVAFDGTGKLDMAATLHRVQEMSRTLERAIIPGFFHQGKE